MRNAGSTPITLAMHFQSLVYQADRTSLYGLHASLSPKHIGAGGFLAIDIGILTAAVSDHMSTKLAVAGSGRSSIGAHQRPDRPHNNEQHHQRSSAPPFPTPATAAVPHHCERPLMNGRSLVSGTFATAPARGPHRRRSRRQRLRCASVQQQHNSTPNEVQR